MSAIAQPKLVKPIPVIRRIIIYATLLPVVFLLGLVPVGLKYMETSQSLVATEHQLSLAQHQINRDAIQTTLASAVIEVQRGHYEAARQAASTFFTSLRAETARGEASALALAQREAVKPLLIQQDAIITLLARNDSASASRLDDIYDAYLKIMNR